LRTELKAVAIPETVILESEFINICSVIFSAVRAHKSDSILERDLDMDFTRSSISV
jgi:hypothetical protein